MPLVASADVPDSERGGKGCSQVFGNALCLFGRFGFSELSPGELLTPRQLPL